MKWLGSRPWEQCQESLREIKSHDLREFTLENYLSIGIPDLVIDFGVPKMSDNDGSFGESCFLWSPIKEAVSVKVVSAWSTVPSLNWNRAVPLRNKIFWRRTKFRIYFMNPAVKRPSDLVQYCPIRAVSDVLGGFGPFNYNRTFPSLK